MNEELTKQEEQKPDYNPSQKDRDEIQFVYDEFSLMRIARNKSYHYFNDRTLKEFVDDSERRLNSYVPTREEQGKEDWQSNFFHPVTRNKAKAIMASVSSMPQFRFKAVDEEGHMDMKRGEVMKNLVIHSILKDTEGRPEERTFFSGWEAMGKGTVIEYDGHVQTKRKVKSIKSFDVVTGNIEVEEKEEIVDEGCVSFIVPVLQLYIKDFFIFNIQKQPSLAWVDYKYKGETEQEFGKYANWKFVKTKEQIASSDMATYFREEWQDRVKEGQYEIIRYYNKTRDTYDIIINGVLLLSSPMLWGKRKKIYPFAKTVFEIFAPDFFYGNSLPNSLMGEQDVINSLYNMSLDKTYRSLVPQLMIGTVNKDDFDLEDEEVSLDTKIYVSDIQQVKPLENPGVSASEFNMIKLISAGLDLSSVDSAQQGVSGKGVTAREIVIADENAKKLKGIFFMFLESLWQQKIRLRIVNILMYYTLPEVKEIAGENGEKTYAEFLNKSFMIPNSELSTGDKGTLIMRMVGKRDQLPKRMDLDIEEEKYRQQGEKVEVVSFLSSYIDEWEYDFQVMSETLYQQSKSLVMALTIEKLNTVAQLFPNIFMANQVEFFRDLMTKYDDDPDRYKIPIQGGGIPQMEGGGGNSELIQNMTKNDTPSLNELVGNEQL